MHIGLGAYLLSGTPGYRQAGIHQYIRALIDAFAHLDERAASDVRFTAFVSPTAQTALPPLPHHSHVSVHVASRSTETPLQRLRVEQRETPPLLRQLGIDLYHGMAFAAPLLTQIPTVITVHDLSFLTRPQTHRLLNRLYLTLMTSRTCRKAARVIAVSEWTQRDVVKLLGVPEARVDVIPHGVHAQFKPLPAAEVDAFRAEHQIGPRSVFFLGSLEPRKNLPTLIDAFHALLAHTPDAELLVGGSPGWKYQTIFERMNRLGLQAHVRFVGQIAQDALPLWYNACAVFAYPSLYEGFGLPVLEAMACGAPVVTSNVTALPEVVGDAGLMVAPTDTAALTAALARVLSDADLRASLRRRGVQRAAGYTWARCAQRTLDTYRRALCQ
jgi:glycosyltransferase involved in cell wall biosynthesis